MGETGAGSIGGILRVVASDASDASERVRGRMHRTWRRLGRAGQAAAVVGSAGTVGTLVATGLGALGVGPLSGLFAGKNGGKDARPTNALKVQEIKVRGWRFFLEGFDVTDDGHPLARALAARKLQTAENIDAYGDKIGHIAAEKQIGKLAAVFREMLVYIAGTAPTGTVSEGHRGGLEGTDAWRVREHVVFSFYCTREAHKARTQIKVSPVLVDDRENELGDGYPTYAARALYDAFESFRREYGDEYEWYSVEVLVEEAELGVYTRAFANAARVVTYRGDEWRYGVEAPRSPRSPNPSSLSVSPKSAVDLCFDQCKRNGNKVGIMVFSTGTLGDEVFEAWVRGELSETDTKGTRDALHESTIGGGWGSGPGGYMLRSARVVRDAKLRREAQVTPVTLVIVRVPPSTGFSALAEFYLRDEVGAGLDAMIAEGVRVAIVAPSGGLEADTDLTHFAAIVNGALDSDAKKPRELSDTLVRSEPARSAVAAAVPCKNECSEARVGDVHGFYGRNAATSSMQTERIFEATERLEPPHMKRYISKTARRLYFADVLIPTLGRDLDSDAPSYGKRAEGRAEGRAKGRAKGRGAMITLYTETDGSGVSSLIGART